jgi:hypothetical protein
VIYVTAAGDSNVYFWGAILKRPEFQAVSASDPRPSGFWAKTNGILGELPPAMSITRSCGSQVGECDRAESLVPLGHKDSASALPADPLQRGLWIGLSRGGVGPLRHQNWPPEVPEEKLNQALATDHKTSLLRRWSAQDRLHVASIR